MKKHKKEITATIIISILAILYYIAYFGLIIFAIDGLWKYLLGIFPIILSFVMLKVCKDRIKEIEDGETDDISKY